MSVADPTVLGMTLGLDDDIAQPLAAACVIKALDSQGRISYYTACTEGLMNVEIVGMMRWGESVALAGDS